MSQKKYTKESLKEALESIASGKSLNAVSKEFKIPKTTLYRRATKKIDAEKPLGAPSILTQEQEEHICTWIKHLGKVGFAVTKDMLLDSVKILSTELGVPNNFHDGRPGRHWYEGFCKRNPSISKRVSQYLSKSRAKVSEENVRNWFAQVKTYLDEEGFTDVLNHPERIFNCDETAFFLAPKEGSVLAEKGQKTLHTFTANDEKECLTTLFMASADGSIVPPMVIMPYKRVPFSVSKSIPQGWGLGCTDSGWMTGETFFEYIANIFYNWLKKKNTVFPVILFLDGHTSHLTLSLSKFCRDNKIILTALLPNATHILQPLDVGFFHPLKLAWRNVIKEWRMKNCETKIKREDFSPLLQKALESPNMSGNVINGFKATGLYPFDANIKYEKLFTSYLKDRNTSTPIKNTANREKDVEHLKFLENEIGKEKVAVFEKELQNIMWIGDKEDENLFYLWRNIKNRINPKTSNLQESSNALEVFDFGVSSLANNLDLDDMYVFGGNILSNLNEVLGDKDEVTINVPSIDPSEIQMDLQSPNSRKNSLLSVLELKSIENINVPTPFKKNLFWPEPSLDKPKKKVKLPAVASSEQWIQYHENKKNKKQELLSKQLERKVQRLNKRKKQNTNQSKPISSFEIQNYVIVVYEKEYFPGMILDVKNNEVQVKTMQMCGVHWKWPEKDDILWYPFEDVITKIRDPELINSRGTYSIKEIENLRKISKDDKS